MILGKLTVFKSLYFDPDLNGNPDWIAMHIHGIIEGEMIIYWE